MRRESVHPIVRVAAAGAVAAIVSASSRTVSAQLVPAGSGKQWATTWSDEFNNGASDLAGWTYMVGTAVDGWGNNELESYTAPPGATVVGSGFDRHSDPTTPTNSNNVFVSTDATGQGALTIRAIGTQSGSNVNYTSGRIRTTGPAHPLAQTYGLFEFRAKMPAGNGLWPALWMMPQDSVYGGWPTSGEIDIFEGKGQDTGYASSTLHSGPSGGDNAQSQTFAGSGLRPAGFTTTAWHTYSLKWEDGPGTGAGTITFYIDGIGYHSRTGGWTVPSGQPGSAPFDQNFHIIMNLAVGGNFVGGNVHPGAGSYDVQVDYVRAYASINSVTSPTWKNDASGNWSTAGNWLNNVVPNSIDATAQFANILTQPRTATVDTPITVGHVTFDSANAYTIGGTQTLTVNTSVGAVPTVQVLSGNHAITAPLLLSKSTTFQITNAGDSLSVSSLSVGTTSTTVTKTGAGALTLPNLRTAGLTVSAGTVTLASAGSASSLALLSISPGASLDVTDNDLILTSTTKSAVESHVSSKRLTSSLSTPSSATGLGVLAGAEYLALGNASFDGFAVASSDTLVKYTWNGDANFSGTVSFDDYVKIDTGFNLGLTGWLNGDFNYSGAVTFDDYVLIDIAFNAQNGTLGRAVDWISGDDRSGSGRTATGVETVIDHFAQFGELYATHFLSTVPEPVALAEVAMLGIASTRFYQRRRQRRKG